MNTHIVKFIAGYDCIKFECKFKSEKCHRGSGGSHGASGLDIKFISKGEKGAVQFVLYTGWIPQYAAASNIGYCVVENWGDHVLPADLGYHSKVPLYEGQQSVTVACEFCDNAPCYYDGSGLNANDAMYSLVNGGDSGLWIFLDAYYDSVFNNEPYPKVIEYEMSLR